MSDTSSSGRRGRGRGPGRPPKAAAVVLTGLALLYVVAGPWVGRQLGVDLPGLAPRAEQDAAPRSSGDAADRSTAPSRDIAGTEDRSPADGASPRPSVATDDLPPGSLKSYGAVQVSPAGLRYGPGSREGHRLKHVMNHSRDQTDRNIHGVFDGSGDQIVAVIDEAYRKAQSAAGDVKREQDGARTIYTVDLKRRIGFVGGQAGQRMNHPPATRIRLVLEGKNVITAYPVNR